MSNVTTSLTELREIEADICQQWKEMHMHRKRRDATYRSLWTWERDYADQNRANLKYLFVNRRKELGR